MKKQWGLGLVLLLVCSQWAQADWTNIDPSSFAVQAAPTRGSAVDQQDFVTLYQEQASRSQADCDEATAESDPTFEAFFGTAAGIFTDAEYAQMSTLMSNTMTTADGVSGHFKDIYQRERPYKEDSGIQPCAPKPGGYSYPSSHATMASTVACVLASVFPARQSQILARGKRIGDLRHIAGVHHPSDVVMGQALGQQICQSLLADSGYQSQLKSAVASTVVPSP